MTDFDYDVKQKKQIARSAFSRKNGSKSKYCSLPSDNMTEAQWKKRNGSIMSYDLKKPMNWVQFTTMPVDIQEEYLRGLSDRYHVTIKCLSDLFGVSWDTVSRYIKTKHSWLKFKRGSQMSPKDKAGFAEFLCGEGYYIPVEAEKPKKKKPKKEAEPAEELEAKLSEEMEAELKEEPEKPAARPSGFKMRRLVTEFEDIYDANAIQNMIRAMLPTGLAGSHVSIRLEIDVLDS